jgi:hypothetical protein
MNTPPHRLHDEHLRVSRIAERLQAPAEATSLRRDIRELMTFLPGHFLLEERPEGAFALVLARSPDDAWRFDRIKDEHARMLELLEALFVLVDREDADADAQALALAPELGRELQAHDRLESAWLAQAQAHGA